MLRPGGVGRNRAAGAGGSPHRDLFHTASHNVLRRWQSLANRVGQFFGGNYGWHPGGERRNERSIGNSNGLFHRPHRTEAWGRAAGALPDRAPSAGSPRGLPCPQGEGPNHATPQHVQPPVSYDHHQEDEMTGEEKVSGSVFFGCRTMGGS